MNPTLQPHGLQPTRLLCPWDFPGENAGVGCHFLVRGIFLTQRSNWGLLDCRQVLYRLSYKGSPTNKQTLGSALKVINRFQVHDLLP